MLESIQAIARGVLVALVFQSDYSTISSFQESRLLIAEAFSTMGKESRMRSLRPFESVISASRNFNSVLSEQISSNVLDQPPYEIADMNLSASWIDLVRRNKVSASINLPSIKNNEGDSDEVNDAMNDVINEEEVENSVIEYGIRLAEKKYENADKTRWVFEEYVQQLGLESDDLASNPLISNINSTLARSQQRGTTSGVDFKRVGSFVAQLQLVRTLRPPPSEGFREATTSDPPPYDPKTDSFVTGPLRLDLRPLVGRLKLSSNVNDSDDEGKNNNLLTTSWDIFHNISPVDCRGHFLLLPSLLNKERNWRGQYLTEDDCHDLVHLTNTIEPVGSMFIGYNSVGAGASQNHIHCHAWPYPSIDSTSSDTEKKSPEEIAGKFCYAVNNVDSIYDFYDVDDSKVEVSYLNYPVFCIQMSSSVANLELLGKTVATCLEAIGEAPHNIGFLNRIHQIEEDVDEEHDENERHVLEDPIEKMVDVFIFVRSKERSSFIPTLKLGISEMMGVFHAQSETELDTLTTIDAVLNNDDGSLERKCVMEQALADISYENDEELWNNIVAKLTALDKES